MCCLDAAVTAETSKFMPRINHLGWDHLQKVMLLKADEFFRFIYMNDFFGIMLCCCWIFHNMLHISRRGDMLEKL